MKRLLLSLIFCLLFFKAGAQCVPANQCIYNFNLIDTFGDSWNGNTMSVYQNGNLITTFIGPTVLDSANNITIPVALCNGQPFELSWNAGGSFPNEVVVKITNPFGQTIYDKPAGVGAQNSLLFQGVVDCSGPICPAPSNVHFTGLNAGSVSVTWTELGSATQWEVLALPIGSPSPTATDVGVITSTNPFTISGLIDGAEYDFYIRAICGVNFTSDWTLPATAIATCPPPATIYQADWFTGTRILWDAGLASQWEVIVQPAGFPAPDASTIGVVVNAPYYFIDSTMEGMFDIYVRAICSASGSVWSAPFPIEITCAQVSNVTVTGNVLSWNPNGSAGQWEIRVQPGNIDYPSGSIYDLYLTSSNPFIVPNMIVGQDYSIFVRSVCGIDDSGVWSTQRHFVFTPLGNNEFRNENIALYPNPAHQMVQVGITNANGNLQNISLIDMVGKVVLQSKNIAAQQTAIDVSGLAKGIYLMEITTDNNQKLVRKLAVD
jgi:hypothetical protein